MAKIEHDIVIDRPVEEVWGFMVEPGSDVKWQSGVVESKNRPKGLWALVSHQGCPALLWPESTEGGRLVSILK